MIIRWHGQSAFTLTGAEHTIAIDPFGPFPPEVAARITFDYPPIHPHPAHLLLVTHEHRDHNAVEAISGEPHVIRSTAGRFETPVGEVVAVASEHDDQAGTARGPNTIFVFTVDTLRIAHFGDLGQAGLRPEQRAAIGDVDLVFIPVGGGPTIDASAAAAIVRELAPAYAIPMHYRTPQIGFLETADAFVAMFDDVERVAGPEWSLPAERPATATRVVVLQPPGA
jgi:L-ascorbate metabolism protein UlaG (beta-lactamase superfamily)